MTRTSVRPFMARHLTETVSIIRPDRTPNGRGGWTNAQTVIWTGKAHVHFSIRPREGEQTAWEQGRVVADFSFDPNDTPPIKFTDKIRWDGADWEVQGHIHHSSDRVSLRVVAWRTQNG